MERKNQGSIFVCHFCTYAHSPASGSSHGPLLFLCHMLPLLRLISPFSVLPRDFSQLNVLIRNGNMILLDLLCICPQLRLNTFHLKGILHRSDRYAIEVLVTFYITMKRQHRNELNSMFEWLCKRQKGWMVKRSVGRLHFQSFSARPPKLHRLWSQERSSG
jgi:hypothetical protein